MAFHKKSQLYWKWGLYKTLPLKNYEEDQVYLWKPLWEQAVAVNLDKLPVGIPAGRIEHEETKRAGVFSAEVVSLK